MIKIFDVNGASGIVQGPVTPEELRDFLSCTTLAECGKKFGKSFQMFVDEDGFPKDLKYNEEASFVIGFPIVGKAALLTEKDMIPWG